MTTTTFSHFAHISYNINIIIHCSLVFQMVEAEEEYTEQMEILVSCFLRPFKMAASSKKPPCSHEDVNSIFLNSETVLFLHQIFLKGLTSRMESWPTLVLGKNSLDLLSSNFFYGIFFIFNRISYRNFILQARLKNE